MRSTYLVSYDVSDPKRWRRVHQLLRDNGEALHYSVFRCNLSKVEVVTLTATLSEIINHRQDRVMIVNLGPSDGRVKRRIVFLGRANETPEGPDEDALVF